MPGWHLAQAPGPSSPTFSRFPRTPRFSIPWLHPPRDCAPLLRGPRHGSEARGAPSAPPHLARGVPSPQPASFPSPRTPEFPSLPHFSSGNRLISFLSKQNLVSAAPVLAAQLLPTFSFEPTVGLASLRCPDPRSEPYVHRAGPSAAAAPPLHLGPSGMLMGGPLLPSAAPCPLSRTPSPRRLPSASLPSWDCEDRPCSSRSPCPTAPWTSVTSWRADFSMP